MSTLKTAARPEPRLETGTEATINFRALVVNIQRLTTTATAPSKLKNVVIIGKTTTPEPRPPVEEEAADTTGAAVRLSSAGRPAVTGSDGLSLSLTSATYADWTLSESDELPAGVTVTIRTPAEADGNQAELLVTADATADEVIALTITLASVPGAATVTFNITVYKNDPPAMVSVLRPDKITAGSTAETSPALASLAPDELAEVNNYYEYAWLCTVAGLDELVAVMNWLNTKTDEFSAVCFTKAVSDSYLAGLAAADVRLAEPDLPLMLTQAAASAAVSRLVMRRNTGCFIDVLAQGQHIYAVTRMAQLSPDGVPTATNAITNSAFSGLTELVEMRQLEAGFISFWAVTRQKSYPYALFAGGVQLYTLLYQAVIDEAIMNALAGIVDKGYPLTRSIPLVEASITAAVTPYMDVLAAAPAVTVPSIDAVSAADRIAGIMRRLEIVYKVFGETRVIYAVISEEAQS
jgi:hypothetical protein